jgi:hypothetical protein
LVVAAMDGSFNTPTNTGAAVVTLHGQSIRLLIQPCHSSTHVELVAMALIACFWYHRVTPQYCQDYPLALRANAGPMSTSRPTLMGWIFCLASTRRWTRR